MKLQFIHVTVTWNKWNKQRVMKGVMVSWKVTVSDMKDHPVGWVSHIFDPGRLGGPRTPRYSKILRQSQLGWLLVPANPFIKPVIKEILSTLFCVAWHPAWSFSAPSPKLKPKFQRLKWIMVTYQGISRDIKGFQGSNGPGDHLFPHIFQLSIDLTSKSGPVVAT